MFRSLVHLLLAFYRYPAIEWSLIGEFKARDVRTVQSFPLDESVYAKFIKVCWSSFDAMN